MGVQEEPRTADDWAAYIVDGVREGSLDAYYQDVFSAYVDHATGRDADAWSPDRTLLARYLHSDPKTDTDAAVEETYWEWVEADVAAFLEDTYATDDARHEQVPDPTPEDVTVDRIYAPGARAVEETPLTADHDDAWMTTIYTVYDEENEEAYGMQTAYLDEDEARDVVQWLLEDGQDEAVTQLLWQSVQFGYDEPMKGFAEELAKADRQDHAETVIEQAEERNYTDEAAQIRAGIESV